MGLDRQLHYHQVIPATEAIIQALRQKFPFLLVMGDQLQLCAGNSNSIEN